MEMELEKTKMESIKAIADANLKVSEARNLLFKLQEQETEYLVVREKKAMDRIQLVMDTSKEMVKEADQNHLKIKNLGVEISEFVNNLLEIQKNFQDLLTEFEERNVEWERDIGKQQDDLVEIRNQQKVTLVQIENDQQNIALARKRLEDDQRKLDSDRGVVERTIKRLKENKI